MVVDPKSSERHCFDAWTREAGGWRCSLVADNPGGEGTSTEEAPRATFLAIGRVSR